MPMQALVIAHACLRPQLASSRATTCSGMWTDADVDHRLPGVRARTTSPNARSATASTRSRSCWTPATRCMNYGVDRYRRPQQALAGRGSARAARSARPTCSSRSTTCGARCPTQAGKQREEADAAALPGRAAGEHPVLHREERAAAGALAARDRAHRAQGRAVLLSAAPDAGDERGLGDVLALHAAEHLYDEGHARRRLHDGDACSRTPTSCSSRRSTTARYSGINPYALGFAMFTDIRRICEKPDRRGPRVVPRHRRQRLAARRWTTRCATSRTRASSASTCRPS